MFFSGANWFDRFHLPRMPADLAGTVAVKLDQVKRIDRTGAVAALRRRTVLVEMASSIPISTSIFKLAPPALPSLSVLT